MTKTLELYYEDAQLLHEAMQRFTRTVAGDMARDKNPGDEIKDKMANVISLGDRIQKLAEEEW